MVDFDIFDGKLVGKYTSHIDPIATNKSAISVSPARGSILVCFFLRLCRSINKMQPFLLARICMETYWKPWEGSKCSKCCYHEGPKGGSLLKSEKYVILLEILEPHNRPWKNTSNLQKKQGMDRYGCWLDVYRVSGQFSPHPKTTVLHASNRITTPHQRRDNPPA